MSSMKNPWVHDLTSFFENLGKSNVRSSLRKKRDSKICKFSPLLSSHSDVKVDETISVVVSKELNASVASAVSEHCIKVKEGRAIFEKFGSIDRHNIIPPIKKLPIKTQPSSMDQRKRDRDDYYFPPIESDYDDDMNSSYNNRTSVAGSSSMPVNEKRKSYTKTPSYIERKSMMKKNSNNYKSIISESDIEKENNGVIIRMKNQETYYDGKDKYQSLLPEAPLCQIFEQIRRRQSQIALQRSSDVIDQPETQRHQYMNSIILHEISHISTDSNQNSINKMCQYEDNDSDELEPNEECDSYSEAKLTQLISQGPQRIKWAETEEGKKLIKIKNLKSDIIKWQESQFEVITSEASYYRSLQILVNKIYKSPNMLCLGEIKQYPSNESATGESTTRRPLMTALQKHHLFSNILEIHICSGELLKSLETRWREDPFIEDLSDILVEFSKEKLRPYITYLRNQRYQTSTFNQLLTNPDFQNVIKEIENDVDCGMMNLSSFLLLPMQRLLRLKLLFTVVKHYIPEGYPTHGCEAALTSLDSLIKECSDQKMLMEQKEEIMKIYSRLTFKQQTGVSIGSKPLLKNGQLKVTPSNNKASRSLNSSFINRNNNNAQLYLFEDQLIIAKTRKLPLCLSSNDDREMVVDICPRSEVKFDACVSPKPIFFARNAYNTNFKLILAKGLKGCAEYTCETDSKENFEEWQTVFSSGINEWEQFEFNNVLVTKDYTSNSDKELDLKCGQILSITKRINEERAIATSGEKQGEIPLACVQFVSTPQRNQELLHEIRQSIIQKKIC